MTNGSKFEPRKQINKALKPGSVRILNLSHYPLDKGTETVQTFCEQGGRGRFFVILFGRLLSTAL